MLLGVWRFRCEIGQVLARSRAPAVSVLNPFPCVFRNEDRSELNVSGCLFLVGIIVSAIAASQFLFYHSKRGVLSESVVERAQLQRELAFVHSSSDEISSFYDLVVHISPNFSSVAKGGWPIYTSPHLRANRSSRFSGPVVSVRGNFNKGKTFFLNLLAHANLPAGTNIHTEGLCFKHLVHRNRDMIFLDTVGSKSPMYSITTELLQDKKAEEDFIRDFTFTVVYIS